MKRLAIVGLGHRSGKFIDEIAEKFRDSVAFAGFCDLSSVRLAAQNRWLRERHGLGPVAEYPPDRFDEMIRRERADTVLVATVDSEHHGYIARALACGCRVITEKPMAVDAEKCRVVMAAAAKHPGMLRVAFNYRWAPPHAAVKELLAARTIGRVRGVLLEWMLDVRHGADYFRRWHSDKASSGGLLVHKATHHFDLVNWWTDSIPDSVFAWGDLMFYGKANAVARGQESLTRYPRYTGVPQAKGDPFRLDLGENGRFKALYLDAEAETGYIRDRNVFREGISIEDNLGVLVRYRGGMLLSYVLNAFSPREGMRVVFNGDQGRIEYTLFGKSGRGRTENDEGHAVGADPGGAIAPSEGPSVRVFPHFGLPYAVPVESGEGGHWGGDPLLMRNLFAAEPAPDPLGQGAGTEQGAASVLVGIAGNRSMAEGRPVAFADVLPLRPEARRLSELT